MSIISFKLDEHRRNQIGSIRHVFILEVKIGNGNILKLDLGKIDKKYDLKTPWFLPNNDNDFFRNNPNYSRNLEEFLYRCEKDEETIFRWFGDNQISYFNGYFYFNVHGPDYIHQGFSMKIAKTTELMLELNKLAETVKIYYPEFDKNK